MFLNEEKEKKEKKINFVYPNAPLLANRPAKAYNLFDCVQKSMLCAIDFILGRTVYCHIF